jgi:DNA-binding transcriptional regulator YiaG
LTPKRLALNLTKTEVAKLLGMSLDCLKNWESSEYSVTLRFKPRVIDFLGVCPYQTNLSIGLKLRQCRENCSLSRSEVYKKLGVSEYELKAIEQENMKPSQEKTKLILKFLQGKIIPFANETESLITDFKQPTLFL